MHMRLSNGTEHTVTLFEAVLDSNDWEEKTKTILKFMDKNDRANIKSRLEDQNILDKIYKIERSMATDKAMKVGGASSIIAGLIAFGGCFAAGVQLPILALVGIAVAAALAVGIVAGGITYAVLKPSNKLDEPYSNKVASAAQTVS